MPDNGPPVLQKYNYYKFFFKINIKKTMKSGKKSFNL